MEQGPTAFGFNQAFACASILLDWGMRVGVAQIAPVFLDRTATLVKVVASVTEAADKGCGMVVFGEVMVPGYPVWMSTTGGAKFNDDYQKEMFAHYLENSVRIASGDLADVCEVAKERSIAVVLGVAERAEDRGGYTIYCSRGMIGSDGAILSIHRKLRPTFDERLVWGAGDGAGLVVHPVGEFTVGALNCWENWMPLARAALYAQGEDLHVMLWPGCDRNTRELTRTVAVESRSFVLSVSGLLRESDIPESIPRRDEIAKPNEMINNGGSAICGPDGEWIIAPVTDREELLVADLDIAMVRRERQNFDASGHYSRPDVLRLTVDRRRQSVVDWIDD